MNPAQVPDKEAAKLKAEEIARMTKNYRHLHSASKRRMHQSIFNGKKQLLYVRMCLGRFCPVRDLHSSHSPFPLLPPQQSAPSSVQRQFVPLPPHRTIPSITSQSHRIIFPAFLQGQQQELSAPKPSPILQQPGENQDGRQVWKSHSVI